LGMLRFKSDSQLTLTFLPFYIIEGILHFFG
jgi:hypothetical protein